MHASRDATLLLRSGHAARAREAGKSRAHARVRDVITQVLYTLPVDRSDPDSALIGESGAMNVFFLLDKVPPILWPTQCGANYKSGS
jgi:hypothetical protein